MLEGERDLLPRPRFYCRCPDASSISLEYVEFILRHIVQQRHQELEQEKLEREKEESERRRQSVLSTDITGKPKRVIPVDPIISTFDSGGDKVPGEDTYIPHRSHEHPSTPDPDLDSDTRDTPHSSPFPHQNTHQLDHLELQHLQKVQKPQVRREKIQKIIF